jgi:hypothetical protein
MGRKTAASGWLVGFALAVSLVGAGFSSSARAEPNCPPGQIFMPLENRCIGLAERRCPEGQQFDTREHRCVAAVPANRCPQGQQFDEREHRCVALH